MAWKRSYHEVFVDVWVLCLTKLARLEMLKLESMSKEKANTVKILPWERR